MDGNLDFLFDDIASVTGDKSVLKHKTPPKPTKIAGYSPLKRTTGDEQIDAYYDRFGKEFDVDPNLLWAQGHQESGFRNNAVSNKGARGVAQFMPGTAAEFRVNVNDPASSIRGQAELMRKLLDRTGDVELSLAGYNSGHNNSIASLQRNRQVIPETRDYVNRITKNYQGANLNLGQRNEFSSDLGFLRDDINQITGSSSGNLDFLKQDFNQTANTNPPATSDLSFLIDDFHAATNNEFKTGKILPKQLASPTQPNPTFPQNVAPVKESDYTIEQQVYSAADMNSPRAAVLLTEQNQFANLPPQQRDLFTPVSIANGTLLVNNQKAAKLGLRNPQDIFKYVEKNGFANLIGKAEDVGNATRDGVMVRTETADGKELSTSKVTNPATADAQIKADQLQFGGKIGNQSLIPAQDAIQKRLDETTDIANLGKAKVGQTTFGATLPPQIPADYAEFLKASELVDSQESRNAYSDLMKAAPESFQPVPQNQQPQQNVRREKPAITAIPAEVKQAENGALQSPNALAPGTYDNLQRESLGTIPLAKTYKQKPTADEVISDTMATAYGGSFNAAATAYRKQTGKDLITFNELRPLVESDIEQNYDPKKGLSGEIFQVNREANVAKFVEAFDKAGEQGIADVLAGGEQTKTDVAAGEKAQKQNNDEFELRQKVIGEITNERAAYDDPVLATNPGVSASAPPEMSEAEIQKRVDLYKGGRIDDETRAQAESDAEWLNSNAGKALDYASPLFRYLSDETKNNIVSSTVGGYFNSVGGVYRTLAGVARPFSGSAYQLLSKVADKSETLGGKTGAGDFTSEVFKIAGSTPTDLAKLMLVSKLPGGIVVGMSVDSALQSAGRGESASQIVRAGQKGAAEGAVFAAAPIARRVAESSGRTAVSKAIAREGATIGTIVGGTVAVELIDGTPTEQAIKKGVVNGLFHLTNVIGSGLLGKTVRGSDKDGNTVTVKVLPDGKVKELKGEVESPDIEMFFNEKTGRYDPVISEARLTKTETAQSDTTQKQIGETAPPRELPEKNPVRVDAPDAAAVQKASVDTRATRITEVLKGKGNVSIDELAKLTRINKNNVEDAVMTLYGARMVEILPDNSVRAISNDAAPAKPSSLYEKAAEIVASREPIKLKTSPIADEISRSESTTTNEITPPSHKQTSVDIEPRAKTVEDITTQTYKDLPEQKLQPIIDSPKPVAKVVSKERENLAEKLNVFTERGTKASIEPKVIDSSDLLTSLDEGYPTEFQPRDRSRAASKAQISEIANKLNPEFLGDSPKASDGRPLVVPVEMPNGQTKYAVISGNGRTQGIREAYNLENEGAAKYAEFAKTKGQTTAKQPVYVGVLDPEEIKDLPEFAKEANESATAQMSATEQAKSDAERLDAGVLSLFVPSDDGTIHTAANRDFTRAFLQKAVPTSEQGRLVDAEGKLNQDGTARVRNAIFARAFGESESGLNAISRMSESTDNNVKNITNGLLARAGQIAALKEAARVGTRHKEFDIAPDLATAMEKYASLKDSDTSVDDYIQQGNLFGAETTPFQTRVMQVFDSNKRSPKAVRTIIGNFLDLAEAAGDPNQKNLFGGKAEVDVKSQFEAAVKKYEQENRREESEQNGLFADQGLSVRREAGGGSDENSQQTSGSPQPVGEGREESRKNRLNDPAYFLPDDIAGKTNKAEADDLFDDLTTAFENNAAPEYLLEKADLRAANDVLYSNSEASELLRRAYKIAFQNPDTGIFYGSYLNPNHLERVRDALRFGVLGGRMEFEDRQRANRFLQNFDKAVAPQHKDLIQIATTKTVKYGLNEAHQEERAHRADYRVGLKHSVGQEVVKSSRDGQKAMRELQAGSYEGASDNVAAIEVIAKLFVGGETETGLTDKEKKDLLAAYHLGLAKNGKTSEDMEAFASVSTTGRRFVENVREYEKEREFQRSGRSNESLEPGTTAKNDSSAQSDGKARRTRFAESYPNIPSQPQNIGNGLLDEIRSGDQRLAKREPWEVLFSRPKVADSEKIEEEAEKSSKSLVSYIYDGKRDVSPTEAAMNIMRTGYLAGLSVLKTNVVGNASNIVVEQLAKPLMATADILNPKATGRTTPGLSIRDIYQGFVGEGGFFRGGFVGEKGFLTALVKGVGEQESSRVDMNVSDKKTNFVRNTGVPLIDVIIEATKRIVVGVDRPFKAYARTAEKSGLARLEASKDDRGVANALKNAAGLDTAWKQKMLELRDNPSRLMNDVAERYAEVVTFQNPNAVTQTYDTFRRFLIDEKAQSRVISAPTQQKLAKYVGSAAYLGTGQIAPFLSTPSNVGFRTLEYFFPTGIVATAFKFHRIGQSLERQTFIENEGIKRAKIIKRLAAVRGNQDEKFNKETQAKKKRLADQKKIRLEEFNQLIEDTRNSKVFTDIAKNERIAEIKAARAKWLEGWTNNQEKYLETRQKLADKAVAERKIVDDIQKRDWESEAAYADIKFSEFENRAFAEAAGRAGFGLTVGSLALLSAIYGIIQAVGTTDYDDEKDKSKQKRAAGIPDNSVSIFGYRFPYAYNPFGNAFKMSLNLFEQYERPGVRLDRASAMAKRFGKDITSLNPLTNREFTKDDWASWAGSKANSMTPLLNLKILQEIGEVADDKPRKYWEEGFAAQYLIKLPKLREYLPESKSFIGGNDERGDIWRRALRALDPLQTTKENKPQSSLPITPVTKNYAPPVTPENKAKILERLKQKRDAATSDKARTNFDNLIKKLEEEK